VPLSERAILIVDRRVGRFIHDLQATLERANAEVLVVRDADKAMAHLDRFDFSACLLGPIAAEAEARLALIEKLGGIPIILFGEAAETFGQAPTMVETLPESVPEIVRALTRLLAADA
jgi:DNA-binding NtrC family response regulator